MGGLAPKGMGNASSVFLAMIAGMEVGLNPMQSMQGIMVVNNRTTMWGDVAFAKCLASPLCLGIREWIEGEGEGAVAHCECVRKGWPEPVHRTFSWAWAKKADLHTKETYQKYPLRMIQMRARAFALRDAFADVLKGMGIAEEAMDFVDVTAAEVAPQPSAKAKTLDQVTEQLEGERAGAGRGRPAGSKNRPKPEPEPPAPTEAALDAVREQAGEVLDEIARGLPPEDDPRDNVERAPWKPDNPEHEVPTEAEARGNQDDCALIDKLHALGNPGKAILGMIEKYNIPLDAVRAEFEGRSMTLTDANRTYKALGMIYN